MMWIQTFVTFRNDPEENCYEVGAFCTLYDGKCEVGEPQIGAPGERLGDGRDTSRVPFAGWDDEVIDALSEIFWLQAPEYLERDE